jgi:hypothetical protein
VHLVELVADAEEPDTARGSLVSATAATNIRDMSLPPVKPKITPEERRRRVTDRLVMIWLKMAICRELDEWGITTFAAIGATLGVPTAAATKLLIRRQWREGDVALLEAAAAWLGVQVPD